jgi:hypothetical protein
MRWLALAALMTASGAHAATIFSDDFQSGKADIWKAAGRGDVRLTTYEGNISLRLTAHGAAVAKVSAKGYRDIAVAVSFAGLGIDTCEADVSIDGGETWIEVHHIGRGQDDGVSMHPGGALVPGADDKDIHIALRNPGDGTCWADNVKVRGQAVASAMLAGQQDMRAFAPRQNASPAKDRFEGRLVLGEERPGAGFTVLRDEFGDAAANGGAARHLPPFDFEFVQAGDVLIPVRRGAIPSAHPVWEFVLEPGRVWQDGETSRASLPFTLEERNANCMHNGVISWRFTRDGTVSDAAWQIASETCRYFKFDLWGRSAVRYVPGPVKDATRIAADYRAEIAGRRPTKPIVALAIDHPGADPAQFGSAAEIDPDDMTAYGVVAGGINYVSDCRTRLGPYPFCAELTLPSYSLAKTLFAGIASMRLSLLYPGAMAETIGAHVPQCAAAKTWDDVTFADALDMASGHYISSGDQVDEDSAGIAPFFAADTHAGKIDFACNAYPRKATPGTQWVYHTADTYALGTAERDFYKAKTGGELYPNVLVKPLWRGLHLDPAIDTTRATYDAVQQPFAGYGLTLHRDDVAKLADFLSVDGGRISGTQMLDPKMLAAALQRDPADPGLQASTGDFRYHNGFWAWNAASYLHCKAPAWIPFLSGYGGIAVALMPNGMTYYYFSDGGVWAWARAAAEADRIKPFCER